MSDRWAAQRRSIGALSVWVGTVGLFAPRAIARLLGVRAEATGGDVSTRSAVMSSLVLATAVAGAVEWHRGPR